MGISAVLVAAVKHIPWGQVANVALEHGPDFIRRLKERLQTRPTESSEVSIMIEQLGERIQKLESALVKQEEMIEQQNRNIELLEEIGKTLQARVNIFMTISTVSVVLAILLFILLLRK